MWKRFLCVPILPLIFVLGCGDERPKPDPIVPIEEVPAPVTAAAKKALPGFTFDTVYKMKIDGKDAFEFRGKDRKGTPREVEVSATGEVLNIE